MSAKKTAKPAKEDQDQNSTITPDDSQTASQASKETEDRLKLVEKELKAALEELGLVKEELSRSKAELKSLKDTPKDEEADGESLPVSYDGNLYLVGNRRYTELSHVLGTLPAGTLLKVTPAG